MPHKILVVDDEPDLELLVRQKFRRQIREQEFEFLFARDGAEALEKVRQDAEIEVVLSDINMPVMDGLTLLSRLNETHRDLKAVIVSAYGDMPNIRTAMNRGAFDFLTKPIDFADFETTIHKTILESLALRQGAKAREELTAIQRELGIAAQIQQSMLPKNFPPYPDRQEFSLYASMFAAKEVGGDFYDFFLIDHNRLGFVIGDVSGKGVPAAIFMAVSRTLLRATALEGLTPGECLNYVNTALSSESDTTMFVSTFYGVLHTGTGRVEYSVGGHNPPFILKPGGVQVMEVEPGIVVGALAESRYQNSSLQLEPGDGMVLYTDGVTEALDAADVLYSEERLEHLLGEVKDQPPEDIVRRVVGDVRRHAGGVAQSDDVTVMAIRYHGQRQGKIG
jgi:sigma-B regulation protein RsbU (phosphoserine phosphatase)